MLWKKPPYIEHSSIAFEASITEYKVNDKKTAVIVCPGGGYFGKADHEKEPIALMLNKGGINAYTLDYSVHVCHKYAPLSDAQRAIRTLRSMGYEKIGILGFSAGGHLTCTAGTMYDFEAYPKTDDIDNFSDTIAITNISKITFQLYNDDVLLGTAISEGANLGRLVQNHKEEFNLQEVTGEQTLNCQFKADSSGYDNGMWVYSDCVGSAADLPDKLVVKVLVGATEYLTTYNREV